MSFCLKWECDHLIFKCTFPDILFMIEMMTSQRGIRLLRSFWLILRRLIFLRKKLFRRGRLLIPTWKLLFESFRRFREEDRGLSELLKLLISKKDSWRNLPNRKKLKNNKILILTILKIWRTNKSSWSRKPFEGSWLGRLRIDWEKKSFCF